MELTILNLFPSRRASPHLDRNSIPVPLRVQAELAWVAGYIMRWYARRKTVTHPSTNRVQRTVTSLIRPTLLALRQTTTERITVVEDERSRRSNN